VRLDRERSAPLRAQLEHELREAIRSGRLPEGERLPSSRQLAGELGLSRGLVLECYTQLQAEGYLVARAGSATRVAGGARVAEPAPAPDPVDAAPAIDFRSGRPDRLRRGLGLRHSAAPGDPHRRARAGHQVPLGLELRVALEHEPAREPELAGELTRRRESLALREAARADRLPQLVLELDPQRRRPLTVQTHEELRRQTGPLNRHRIGPYQQAGWRLPCLE